MGIVFSQDLKTVCNPLLVNFVKEPEEHVNRLIMCYNPHNTAVLSRNKRYLIFKFRLLCRFQTVEIRPVCMQNLVSSGRFRYVHKIGQIHSYRRIKSACVYYHIGVYIALACTDSDDSSAENQRLDNLAVIYKFRSRVLCESDKMLIQSVSVDFDSV